MAYFRYNRTLLLIILLGFLASLFIVGQRYRVESANSTVELVMDYEDIAELARIEGMNRADLMRQFRDAGISTLAVYDVTLEKLHKAGKAAAVAGGDILYQSRTGMLADPQWRKWVDAGQISPDSVYVTGAPSPEFSELRSDLQRRFGSRVTELTGGSQPLLAIKGSYEKLIKVELGISSTEIAEAAAQGFYIIARPVNYSLVQEEDIRTFFSRLGTTDKISAIIFTGTETLGYPKLLDQTEKQLKESKLTVGLIEHPVQLQFYNQAGLLPMVPGLGYNVARVYSIPKDEQPKLSIDEATHRWALSDQERNIRINLMRRYEKPVPGKSLLETNLSYVKGTREAIEAKGYQIGKASVFPPYFPPRWLLALAAIGIAASSVLFITQLHPFSARTQYIALALLSALLAVPILLGGGTLARQVAALGAAILLPVLAITWQLDRWRRLSPDGSWWYRVLRDGVGGLVAAFAVSMIGAVSLAALLTDVRFWLEMEIFRGVKLTFVLPLLLIALVYLTRYNLFDPQDERDAGRILRQVARLLDYPVSIKILMLFGIGAVGAWIFIGRSGHTAGVPVPAIEVKLRGFLERAVYARPREKEFLIGHPAFLLAVMAVTRQWPRLIHFLLVIAATIGQSTLVETFAHMRTPMIMSTIRGFNGILFGAAIGLLLVVGVHFLACLSTALTRRASAHE